MNDKKLNKETYYAEIIAKYTVIVAYLTIFILIFTVLLALVNPDFREFVKKIGSPITDNSILFIIILIAVFIILYYRKELKRNVDELNQKLTELEKEKIFLQNQEPILKKTLKTWNEITDKIKKGNDVEIDGAKLALEEYMEGIKSTKSTFRATSFLNSQFWRYNKPLGVDIVNENKNLSVRVKKAHGYAQRLFIINEPLQKYINRLVKEAYWHKREENDETLVDELKQSVLNLENLSKSFDVQIIETTNLRKPSIETIDFTKYEYAIFDDFRLDKYKVDRIKNIISVVIYPKTCESFETLSDTFIGDFDYAWNEAKRSTIDDFFGEIKSQIQIEDGRIGYPAKRLIKFINMTKDKAKYPFLEKESNKTIEICRQKLGNNKEKFDHYLDVGVCTARYPSLLIKEGLVYENKICTIDNDPDVEKYMKLCHCTIPFVPADIRFSDELTKISKKKYDLITCMLGTASHFGLDPISDKGRTGFEQGIHNILQLLEKKGLLIISVWSESAKNYKDFLEELYKDAPKDVDRLINNNPNKALIKNTLKIAKNEDVKYELEDIEIEDKLDIYIIVKS